MIIAVDAVGGDFYPQNPIKGALEALKANEGLTILFVGPEQTINEELAKHEFPANRVQMHHAPQIIGMEESPSSAVKAKQESSIAIGLALHAKGQCDAFISAGNTGALLAASAFILGRLDGVLRPTIATVYPTIKGIRLVIDAGANLEVRPEMLVQFAKMGKLYCKYILGIEKPRIGLINVGEEEEKGTDILKKTHNLMKSMPDFVGNVEGRDILMGAADVFVCDGTIGNILLKLGESIPEAMSVIVGAEIKRSNLSVEQATLVSTVLKKAFSPFDYQQYGGVPFLGVNGISMVGHGGSSPEAIKNMILNAVRMAEVSINKKIVDSLND